MQRHAVIRFQNVETKLLHDCKMYIHLFNHSNQSQQDLQVMQVFSSSNAKKTIRAKEITHN